MMKRFIIRIQGSYYYTELHKTNGRFNDSDRLLSNAIVFQRETKEEFEEEVKEMFKNHRMFWGIYEYDEEVTMIEKKAQENLAKFTRFQNAMIKACTKANISMNQATVFLDEMNKHME